MLILILHICLTLSRKAQGLGIAFFRCTNTAQRHRAAPTALTVHGRSSCLFIFYTPKLQTIGLSRC